MGILNFIFDSNEKQIKSTDKLVANIRAEGEKLKDVPFEDIRKRVSEMREELKKLVDKIPEDAFLSVKKVDRTQGLPDYENVIIDKLQEFLPETFAMLNEVYRRKTGTEFHDVQFKAGILLSRGQRLVEQYTGEGKTRTFQLPLVLFALVGRGAHLVTVNEYLAKVGAEYAGHMISELGLTVGVNTPNGVYKFIADDKIESLKGEEVAAERSAQRLQIDAMSGVNLVECTKREAYACDIAYSTNNEIGFDYLRDNMAWELSRMVQRELYFCIIDEADSILIDEARTPLIISAAPQDSDTEKYSKFASAVKDLEEETHYTVNHKDRAAALTEEGIKKVESNLGLGNLWSDYSAAFHIENALKAKALFQKDDEYIVRGGEVLIVDEFTGRVLKGRRYSEGLHQAIEAKEGVEVKQESRTYATITFQNLFRMYKILCGGSGTIITEGEEFYKIYGLESVVIPTNKPRIREDLQDMIFKTADAKFRAVVEDVAKRNEKGQPVLIGTTSVDNSEIVSKYLDEKGIKHEVLNAKFHEQESRIVANAGKPGAVTVATNMAGRGTDIVIGGGARGDAAWKEVADLGGLHVVGTERHDSRRIDNQLRGRTGRQGEPGSTQFYVSLEDKIMRVLGGEIIARLMNVVKVSDDTPIQNGLISKQIETAQKRVEGVNFDSRKRTVDYDDVMNQHREIFYARRKGILLHADHADGKFMHNGRVINLKNPEHADKREDYQERIEASKERILDMARDITDDEVDYFIESRITGRDISDERAKEIVDELVKLIPGTTLVKVTNKSGVETEKELIKLVKEGNKTELESIMNQSFSIKLDEFGEEFYNLFKMLSLEEFDKAWVDHLELMKDVRDGIGLQGYAQRNPLVEYKNEAYRMFDSFINKIDSAVARKLFRVSKVRRTARTERKLETNDAEVSDILTGDREMLPGDTRMVEKMSSVVDAISKSQKKVQSSLKTNSSEQSGSKPVQKAAKTFGRNDRVTVKYNDGTVQKDVKYKKVSEDVESGNAAIIG